jgi:hypothetical protein
MSGNTTSLYATTSSTGNVTIPSNNNTGLYNTSASPASSVNNNLNVNNLFASGNIYASGTIQSGGNMSTSGSFVAAGNVTAQNFIGNFAGNISGNIVAAGANTQVQFNNSNALGASANLTFNNATNLLSVTGNVAATYFQGNGSQLTGLPATYGNSNVTTLLASFGSNTISTTGNITTGYIIGNGSQLTGVVSSYGNANVANYLPVYSGSLDSVNNITASGNITAVRFATTGAQGNIVGPNYVSANFFVGDGSLLTNLPASSYGNANVTALMAGFGSNTISTTGNITSGYLFGNGSQLTGLPATYSNANVTTLLANFGSNSISTTGNVTASYVVGNGSLLTNLTGANVVGTVANATFATTAGTATSATTAGQANFANVANSVSGGNVSGQVANALVAGTVYTAAQPNITSVGNLTSLTVTGDSLLQGNLQVNGNVTYIASNTVVINDKFINVANNAATASAANGGGIGVGPVGAEYATWSFSDANTAWQSNIKIEAPSVTTTGNVTANYVIGNGSLLTNINAGNIVGAYGNANVATFLGTGFGSNTIVTTGNVTAGNVNTNAVQATGSGGLALKNSAGTTQASLGAGGGDNFAISVSTNLNGNNAQIDISPTGTGHVHIKPTGTGAVEIAPTNTGSINNMIIGNVTPRAANVTTLGTTGNITAAGILTDNYYYANGAPFSGGGTYGNANVNSLLSAWGSNSLSTTGNVTAGNVTGGNILTAGTVSATGNIAGNYFIGNGSALTGISATPGGTAYQFQYNNSGAFGGIPNTNYYSGNGTIEMALTKFEATGTSGIITVPGTAGYVSVVGNVNTGNLNLTGQIYDSSGVLQLNGSGNIVLVPVTSTQAYGNVNIIGGKLTADAVTYANADGTNGQVLTTYGNGVTYFSTVAGGGGSPGGANTQLQFNDGGAFAGNSAMTFDKTTGNIILGNVAINGQRILTSPTGNVDPTAVTSVGANPWQLRIGNGFNGTYTTANAIFAQTSGNSATGVGFRLQQSDVYNLSNTTGRVGGIVAQNYVNLTANISNNTSRFQGFSSLVAVGGGASGNTLLTTVNAPVTAVSSGVTVGNVNANLSMGNSTVSTVTVNSTTLQVATNSTVNTGFGTHNTFTYGASTGNIGNLVGFAIQAGTGPANANIVQTSNAVSFYHAASTSANTVGGFNNGNIIRMSTNYHAFRNDDDLAKSRLGMLDRFHELNANTSTSTGTVNIDKNSGQVQTIYPTGNVTVGTFSNFVTRVTKPDATFVNTADTVTLIIQQGATPYSITMPTGNTQIRYAAGLNTVGATANTTTMISITGVYDYTAAGNEYLITISPEFS